MENTIKEISRLNNEPQCITDYKLSKWEEYNHSPNPDKVTHLWKYSDPKWFELNGFTISEKQADSRLTIPEEYSNKGIIFCTIKEIFKIQPLKRFCVGISNHTVIALKIFFAFVKTVKILH